MDLTQDKLSKAEWTSIEVPVSQEECRIIELIKAGYNNVQIKNNNTLSILRYLKVSPTEHIDTYIYVHYLQKQVSQIAKKSGCGIELVVEEFSINEKAMKKADIIRFANTDKQITENNSDMFEFILLDLFKNMCKQYSTFVSKKPKNKKKSDGDDDESESDDDEEEEIAPELYDWLQPFYTLQVLIKYNVELLNEKLKKNILAVLKYVEKDVDMTILLSRGYDLIERNEYLLKYADEGLYEHQKQLFTICKRPEPKLVLYIAPTGTGKTLSPLGLSESYRVIFVCAARHVGLALAKAAISVGKKVAFAFGCNDAEDIRLHFYAAKECTRNKKSGGIQKVDNSIGDNVEIVISDIQSYLPAMYYMLAFNPKEKIIMYWDEPTITLDYPEHEFHSIIKKNWSENIIPNVVLSSATLPQRDEISETIMDFQSKFESKGKLPSIHEIISHDCKKTIPIINNEGFTEMPHYLSADYSEILEIVAHCQKYPTLLRYLDLTEALKFILYVNDFDIVKNERYDLESIFPNAESLNMSNIKMHYLNVLGNLKPGAWGPVYRNLLVSRKSRYDSSINIVTSDANTLTDGPTIFLADDVNKVSQFCIKSALIPQNTTKDIMDAINFNSKINAQISVLEKDYEDGTKKDEEKENKMSDGRVSPEMKKLSQKISALKESIKKVSLNSNFIPNTRDHLYKWTKKNSAGSVISGGTKPFTSDIPDHVAEKIMLIDDVDDSWKLLLLMGIGVFAGNSSTSQASPRYTEIMKTLAQQQKLYLIIASSDYIYGTNYQFCHGYISKDLCEMSQEKCIQAMGRVGRNKLQHNYSVRFRDNELIKKLFNTDENKPEVVNMGKLFCS
jgi:hypothetical protein